MKIASVAEIKAQFSAYLKEAAGGPVVVTKNGKPIAVLLRISDEDEIERLLLAYSPKFQALVTAAEARVRATGGVLHDEFWQQLDADYEDPSAPPASVSPHDKLPGKRQRKLPAATPPVPAVLA